MTACHWIMAMTLPCHKLLTMTVVIAIITAMYMVNKIIIAVIEIIIVTTLSFHKLLKIKIIVVKQVRCDHCHVK